MCGASRGIGAATAETLADLGAQVALIARDQAGLESVKARMKNSDQHRVISQDLTALDSLKEQVDALVADWGAIEILVCNSGGPKAGPILQASEEEFLKGFWVHVLANNTLVKKLAPGMAASGYGRIINIISTSVKIPIPNLGVSNTIRGAVASWAKTLSMELGPDGITVNNVLPGYTETDRLVALVKNAAEKRNVSEEDIRAEWKNKVPLRRFADPKETAQAVAFLASPLAAYISGVSLPVDGGRTGSL